MSSSSPKPSNPSIRYKPDQDFLWLIVKPWIWIPRIIQLFIATSSFAIKLLIGESSKNKQSQKKLAKELLETLIYLGPCFIKIGQALSTRPDLIRRDWLEALTNLQDNLPPFPHEIALRTIEEDLGAKADQLFKDFPKSPIAAASLGQVYKARLHGSYWVAVKIQRPDLEFILRRDLVIIRFCSVILSPVLPLNLGFGIGEIIDEFGRSLFDEINYKKEADNAVRFSCLFANTNTITIPKVERLLSSQRVITTSWINGTKLLNRKELIEKGFDPTCLIRTGVISGIRQLLEFGYFHADPHPGNMFALEGKTGDLGHIAYVDFGMMDSISNEDRITLTGAVVHLIDEDFDSLARDFQKLGFLSQHQDISKVIPALKEVLSGSLGASVGTFNFKSITDRFSELMYEYPFRVPARFALIIRAVVSQEGLALRLDPQFKIIEIAYPYVAKRLLSAETKDMLEILLDVIFDKSGRIRIERIESLLGVLNKNNSTPQKELLPIVFSGLKLLAGADGYKLRRSLILKSIKDNRIYSSDMKRLTKLIIKEFSPPIIYELLGRIKQTKR